MDNKVIAIYVRRSVSDEKKEKNSFSIKAQQSDCIAFCERELPNREYKLYVEDGKSAKDNAHRPVFMQMMSDARDGFISHIVVKKLDRFGRNTYEASGAVNELEKYDVAVISTTEQIDTSTPAGRLMVTIIFGFAQSERETIANRVKENYAVKARETGFYQGGKIYFGYKSERVFVDGKKGSVLVPDERAAALKAIFEVYSKPDTSLQDCIIYLRENDFYTGKGNIDRSWCSRLLESPLYVRADQRVYHFMKAQGFNVKDDISAYDGIHGLLQHCPGTDEAFVKVGYHEGLVDADTWLMVQEKKAHNRKWGGEHSTTHSWITGLVKCSHCHNSVFLTYHTNVAKTSEWRYYFCRGAFTTKGCVRKMIHIRPNDVERAAYEAIKRRINQLEIAKEEMSKPDPKMEKITAELVRIDESINNYVDKLEMADEKLFSIIQDKITKLSEKKETLEQELHSMKGKKQVDTSPLVEPMSRWDSLTMEEKHIIAVQVIDAILISDEVGIDIKYAM